ncbi:PREDICTED: zinc finger CCCH domain-containing protein 10-like isoform X2 [Nicrophorus vespilloides]|uniref:Zinc finger CCCH domain-containing protein 10-like isoform X2 n=1 Tax=Nicrophorus vespilloides TaxID=110193 RepID=A0ABM1M920_NICVS|nr:PREDICTED: zinc finger CCCH domain-containing protein 10-like isoform X2 [Nicrophorus vespilloides]
MSDTSEDSKDSRVGDINQDNICRDFIRGMCERKFCKFKHDQEPRILNFCHDYQNTACPRPACKFIHCTIKEVEEYKRSGEMSNQILAEATRKNQLPGINPICNSFRKGTCRRTYCKYRHISKEEEDSEIMELIKNNSTLKSRSQSNIVLINEPTNRIYDGTINNRRVYHFEEVDDLSPSLPKRRLISSGLDCQETIQHEIARRQFSGYFAGSPPSLLSRLDARSIIILEEENNLLQKEVAQLKKQVSDLTATNEFLLDQNATLRVSSKRHSATVTVPAVTITNTLPQNNGQVIRTVAASVATVPVSLATVTTCNPVSGNPVSIAGCPAVSIAPAAQILAPSQQILVTTNQSTQLALANSSQAQLAIAQQNLANNLAQQAQPQLTSQAQQLALATTTQQLTSQAQHMANQQMALATAPQQMNSQTQQMAINNNQQITLLNQQLTSQAQQLALANTTQQLTSQAQQLALANSTQQLTSQAQQMALANSPQQLAVANVNQRLALASTSQQLLAQQNLANNQQIELHRNSQLNGINTSQTMAMSNATPPMVSYPIMTHALPH